MSKAGDQERLEFVARVQELRRKAMEQISALRQDNQAKMAEIMRASEMEILKLRSEMGELNPVGDQPFDNFNNFDDFHNWDNWNDWTNSAPKSTFPVGGGPGSGPGGGGPGGGIPGGGPGGPGGGDPVGGGSASGSRIRRP